MHTIDALRQEKWKFIVFFAAIGAFILTACSANSSNYTTTGTASTPSPMPTSGIVRGYGTTYGCPADVVVSTAPAAANVLVRPGLGHTTFSARQGDVMEVQMPFGIAWKSPDLSGRVVQMQSPAGYVWKPSNACIWRYVARDGGTVKLIFFGTVLCKQNIHCALATVIDEFTIKVA
jgi:hypothetical protein